MKRTLIAGVLSVCFLFAQFSAAVGAGIDTSAPFIGQYLLAVNTSTDVSVAKFTGTITGNINEKSMSALSMESVGISEEQLPIVGVNDADGSSIYQVDPTTLLKKGQEQLQDSPNIQMNMSTIEMAQYSVGEQKTLYTFDFVQNKYITKTFTLKHSGIHCTIWLEDGNLVALTESQISDLGNEYDTYIYPNMASNFGTGYDRDTDGKLAIVLYDIQDGFNNSTVRTYVGGYFDSFDLSGNVKSNKMDVIHIDTYPGMGINKSYPVLNNAKNTMVHELQHLINYSYYFVTSGITQEMPIWLNEGLSMAAEHMLYGALSNRIIYYSNSETIKNGRSLFDWNNNNPDILANYSLSYVFMQYLRTQTKAFAGGGTEIYKTIIQSTNRTATVVEDVMRQFYPTLTLGDILTNFHIATILKESSGYYGFMSESGFASLNPGLFTGSSADLKGGGAVIRQITSSVTPPGGTGIRYVGFSTHVTTPVANQPGGIYAGGQTVTLSCATAGATIKYTTDGTDPSWTNGMVYSNPIILTSDTTIKAIGVKSGYGDSGIAVFNYAIIPYIVTIWAPANASIGETEISASIPYNVEPMTIDLAPNPNSSWKLYRDAECTDEIADKRVNLSLGNNTVYIRLMGQWQMTQKVYVFTLTVYQPAPSVLANDVTNIIEGMDLVTMEYAISTDGGTTYGQYTSDPLPSLGGHRLVKVRIKGSETLAASADTTLVFTPNQGDVNGDGIIDVSDVIIAIEIVIGNYTYGQDAVARANVNNQSDMTVDISDVILISRRSAGFLEPFVAELP